MILHVRSTETLCQITPVVSATAQPLLPLLYHLGEILTIGIILVAREVSEHDGERAGHRERTNECGA